MSTFDVCVCISSSAPLDIPRKNPQNISGMLLVAWWAEISWEYFFFKPWSRAQTSVWDLLFSSLSSHHPHLTVRSITSYLPLYIHTTPLLPSLLLRMFHRDFVAALAPSIGQKIFCRREKNMMFLFASLEDLQKGFPQEKYGMRFFCFHTLSF